EIILVTPEARRPARVGPAAGDAVSALLTLRGIAVETSVVPVQFADRVLRTVPDRRLAVDAVVALPRLDGPSLSGIPHDDAGFVPPDEYGWVLGLTDVCAARDLPEFPPQQCSDAARQDGP